MDGFTFCAPTKVVFGRDTIPSVGGHIAEHGVSRVLLVFGGGSVRRNGVYDAVTASLRAAGVAWEEFWGVQPNPSLAQVEAGVDKARAYGAQGVLAVGGGSVIDCGKAIAAGCFLDDYWTYVETRKLLQKALPVFTVLTLSGTGTEMNEKAVITNEPEAKKWSVSGLCICPRVTIIDPQVQADVPWHLTMTGGIDAMTHVMENYFRGRLADAATGFFHEETTLQLNEGLLRGIVQSLNVLQRDPAHYGARASLAWAACWGLNGLTVAGLSGGDWTSHALEHALSGRYPHIPHGAGLAVLFPSWMEEVCDVAPAVFARFARTVWGVGQSGGEAAGVAGAMDADPQAMLALAREGVAATRRAFAAWGAPADLSHWGVTAEDVPEMVRSAFGYRALGRLVPLNEEQVTRIFMRVL